MKAHLKVLEESFESFKLSLEAPYGYFCVKLKTNSNIEEAAGAIAEAFDQLKCRIIEWFHLQDPISKEAYLAIKTDPQSSLAIINQVHATGCCYGLTCYSYEPLTNSADGEPKKL